MWGMESGKEMIFKENAEKLQDPLFHSPTVTYLRIISNVNSTEKMWKTLSCCTPIGKV